MGDFQNKKLDIVSAFESYGEYMNGTITGEQITSTDDISAVGTISGSILHADTIGQNRVDGVKTITIEKIMMLSFMENAETLLMIYLIKRLK